MLCCISESGWRFINYDLLKSNTGVVFHYKPTKLINTEHRLWITASPIHTCRPDQRGGSYFSAPSDRNHQFLPATKQTHGIKGHEKLQGLLSYVWHLNEHIDAGTQINTCIHKGTCINTHTYITTNTHTHTHTHIHSCTLCIMHQLFWHLKLI